MRTNESTSFGKFPAERETALQTYRPSFMDESDRAGAETGAILDAETFASIVANTPLVAIDLIVKDRQGRILFGRRRNSPAQGYLFVPGGRILKNESLDAAFSRIAHAELGLIIGRSGTRFIGVFEHFYDTDFTGREGKSTHYIVLAHSFPVSSDSLWLPLKQHSDYVWVHEAEVARHPDIHPYAKAYFSEEKS